MTVVPPSPEPPALKTSLLRTALMQPQGCFGRVEVVGATGSTNADLAANAAAPGEHWPDLSVLIADAQEAGQGRMGRSWEVPAGAAMISSVFLRPGEQSLQSGGSPDFAAPATAAPAIAAPAFAATGYGWLSVLAGLALCGAVRTCTGVPAELKWPNDVVVRGRKLAGILAQVVPARSVQGGSSAAPGPGVVVGVGVNVSARAHELPGDKATSLLLEDAAELDRNVLLPAYLLKFADLYREFVAVGGDAIRPLTGGSSVLELAQASMGTLGQKVRAELPGGAMLYGTATALANDGSLLLRDAAGAVHAVNAGDVIHLRRTGTDGSVNYA
ncbi:biotin--[acetyl-CoA-carboxylase] ligase [Arthrobacter sp. H35-D1]|uniref:biotin--[acetyl-CoA-carboxylase] ligase n=1 Tax=Arthrobacter sp. H35-D1 TaxID=3046202 RepID=UPI0024BABD9B|nr:biotin--[acetyl-CoA-carboxylase] ligase [Arthrobacter sp. H35-D1]MDJ0314370.1 biotin--[acetyl-CoA-carboxylase] ligase [Arthrobacter sp. H35-D1]